jgi:Flp pilus assembly protein TadD
MLRNLTPFALTLIIGIPGSALAAGSLSMDPQPQTFNQPQRNLNQPQQRPGQQQVAPESGDETKARKKKRQENRSEWRDLYRLAVSHVQDGQYETAIATFVSLEDANSPDVENYLGYANRKMGRMEEARTHYQNALALDPDHRGALEYFGEWHVEMGKLDEAQGLLRRLAGVCGTNCQEYQALADAIAGKRVH